jgi:hypothetical protein
MPLRHKHGKRENRMSRLVLASSFMGKTYANNTYSNVYDFDQYTLRYKYNREDYPHLTDEQFKGLRGRKVKDGWFEKYMDDFCAEIDASYYDVMVGWLQHNVVDDLIKSGYTPELVLFSNEIDPYRVLQRGLRRGNEYTSVEPVAGLLRKIYNTFTAPEYIDYCKVWVAHDLVYLDEFLVSTGTALHFRDDALGGMIRDVSAVIEQL